MAAVAEKAAADKAATEALAERAAADKALDEEANEAPWTNGAHGLLLIAGVGLIATLMYYYLATQLQRSVVVGSASAAIAAHIWNGGYDAARQVYTFVTNHAPLVIAVMALCFALPATGAVIVSAKPRQTAITARLDGVTVVPHGYNPAWLAPPAGATSSLILERIVVVPHGEDSGPPSPPPSPPPQRATQVPRVDLLTDAQTHALWCELLAGCEQPDDIPEGAKKLIICDTGCARTVLNHRDQTEPNSVRKGTSNLCGADGKFSAEYQANSRLPMPTNEGSIGVYRESNCILHEPCPYVLLAIGLGSIQQGISMWMPPWGAVGYFEFPSGVQVPLLNSAVTVVRPIGYKNNPSVGLAAVTASDLGVPAEGRYIFSICSGKRRCGDLGDQMREDATVVHIDLLVGGCKHNIVFVPVASALVTAAGDKRCKGAFMSLDCSTWSCAHLLPRNDGAPGKALRAHPDHVCGIANADGALPRKVAEANTTSEHAVQIARACYAHGACVMSETPACRREGTIDYIRGCESHAYMYDHPAWRRFIEESGASVTVADQCMSLDEGMEPSKAAVKATAWLGTPDIATHIKAEFGGRRCTHERGTHRSLGSGANPDGVYPSVGSQQYTAATFKLIANCFRGVLGVEASGGAAAGLSIIHGKSVPKSAITGEFLHRIAVHSEKRVLRKLHCAWADAEEWMSEKACDGPCEQCLQGDASRLGPSGSLPTADGLVFIDVHHTNVEPHDGSGRNVLGVKHAASKFTKTVRMRKKSDAPDAIMLCYSYFNSVGRAWTWIHCDNAPDLRGAKIGALAKKHGWRITCTNVASSNQNPIEPEWRWFGAAVRKAMCMEAGHGVPYEFFCYIWDHEEEGRALKPSRSPPHDCRLGRLLNEKPNGMHRRPALCLCYVVEAPRLPSGTLVHKMRPQATRGLHLCYMGGRSGSCDKLGVERCKPGYACLVCRPDGSVDVVVTDNVRFIPDIFPGMKRLSGGGWCIPSEHIPFSASSKVEAQISEAEKTADVGTKAAEGTSAKGVPDGWKETDPDHIEPDELKSEFEVLRGFAPEGDDAPAPKETTSTPSPAPKESKASDKPRFMVSRARWPEYECDELGGKGWEITVLEKRAVFWRCKFSRARNKENKPWPNEWIPKSQISRIEGTADTPTVIQEADPRADGGATVTPNVYTKPHADGADPMRDPGRPQRNRHEPERYTVSAMCAAYAEAAGASFNATSPRMPIGAFSIDTETGLRRLQERACASGLCLAAMPDGEWSEELDGKVPATPDELGVAFAALEPELQRAACIMMDYDEVAAELGADSPQALMVREVYAAQMVEAARAGLKPRALEPLLVGINLDNPLPSPSHHPYVGSAGTLPSGGAKAGGCSEAFTCAAREITATIGDMFDDKFNDCMFMQAHDNMPNDLAALAKAKTSPDIFSERQMCGPEWDEPKCKEINSFYRLGAVEDVLADDPRIKGMPVCDSMWAGRCKRDVNGNPLSELKGRCVVRGDLQTSFYNLTPNQTMSPVVRNTSLMAVDCVACLRSQHMRPYDYSNAYLQGTQRKCEQMVIRPPVGFRRFDERGVEILWLMQSPLYGQVDAGAIWNRTCNEFYCNDETGLGLERCTNDPCVYGKECSDGSRRTEHAENADELVGYADSDWGATRSTTGFLIMLGGAAIAHASRRQHCITMSSCEAELVALADLAIEMLYMISLLAFTGYVVKYPIKCFTDNKGAYDLCHRFTSAQNSRHIDRKVFKMRELRGAGTVSVAHVATKLNPADIFTKITDRQTFERHRATVLGLAAARGAARPHREAVAAAPTSATLALIEKQFERDIAGFDMNF